jgi:hypothetical protein
MTQEERWQKRYDEVVDFIDANKRNPSKHRIEEHDMLNWLKANRKVLNVGKMKEKRVEKLTIVDFRHDSTMIKRAYHCARCSESLENFWN